MVDMPENQTKLSVFMSGAKMIERGKSFSLVQILTSQTLV